VHCYDRRLWHSLNRFPVQPPGTGFALLTWAETQREVERQSHEGLPPRIVLRGLTAQYGYAYHFTIRSKVS
jgi:hypothetical protein